MNHSLASIRSVIHEEIRQIAPEADLESLNDSADFRRELEIDSFDFLRLLIALHERLGVDFPEAEYGRLASIRDLTAFIGKNPSPASPPERA
jgi:acyl carrier protein